MGGERTRSFGLRVLRSCFMSAKMSFSASTARSARSPSAALAPRCRTSVDSAANTSSRTLSSRSENRRSNTGRASAYSCGARSGNAATSATMSWHAARRTFHDMSSSSP